MSANIKHPKRASALERAGLDGDTAFISENTGQFIETLDDLIKKLTPKEGVNESITDIKEDTALLSEQLQIIKEACKNYDDTTAYAALDRLKEKPLKEETAAVLESIRDALYSDSDFEGTVEQVEMFIQNRRLAE